MRRRFFLTFFDSFDSVLSHKDVGAIPYHLNKYCGWETGVLSFDSSSETPSSEYSQRVKLIRLPYSGSAMVRLFRVVAYLLRNGRGINVLNVYHCTFFCLFFSMMYKVINPGGIVYCKLDMSHLELALIKEGPGGILKTIFYRGKRAVKRLFSFSVDFFSVESCELKGALENIEFYKGRIYYIPNGFPADNDMDVARVVREKKDIIITVGRLGSYPKNTELFLDAVCSLPKELVKGWKFLFVGSPTPEFQAKFTAVLRSSPWLINSVSMPGYINDKSELAKIYKDAKYLCMPSRWESFCFAVLEGMFYGCLPIATPLPPIMDMTGNGKLGYILQSGTVEDLARILRHLIVDRPDNNSAAIAAHDTVVGRFNWRIICGELNGIIEKYAC